MSLGENVSGVKAQIEAARAELARVGGKACDRFVSPGEDLQTILDTSSNLTVCLRDGDYYGPFYLINVNNLTLRSAEMWQARLVGPASDPFVLQLDNCSNVSFEYFTVTGGTDGISVINDSRDCMIGNNHIFNFTEDGASVNNTQYTYILDNLIGSNKTIGTTGINTSNSNHIWMIGNTIKVFGFSIRLENTTRSVVESDTDTWIKEVGICRNGCGNWIKCKLSIRGSYECWCRPPTEDHDIRVDINDFSCNRWD